MSISTTDGVDLAALPAPTEAKTKPQAFRLTATAATLLEECARVAGVSKVAIMEQSIRDTARRAGVSVPMKQPDD